MKLDIKEQKYIIKNCKSFELRPKANWCIFDQKQSNNNKWNMPRRYRESLYGLFWPK